MFRQRLSFVMKVLSTITAVYILFQCALKDERTATTPKDNTWSGQRSSTTFDKDRESFRTAFVGGPPYSGATLMTDLLNLHPSMKCRVPPKSLVLSRLVGLRAQLDLTQAKSNSLREVGLTNGEIDAVVKKYILNALGAPLKSNEHIASCVEDDSVFYSMGHLRKLIPRSKFILVVRDGRTLVQSIISGKVKVTGYEASNHEKCFIQWNENVRKMYTNCLDAGSLTCTVIHYEKLQRNPEKWLKHVLNFLEVDWKQSFLHNLDRFQSEEALKVVWPKMKENGTEDEKENDAEQIPLDTASNIKAWAPMLQTLGYL